MITTLLKLTNKTIYFSDCADRKNANAIIQNIIDSNNTRTINASDTGFIVPMPRKGNLLQWLPWIGIKSIITLFLNILLNSLLISIFDACNKISIWPKSMSFPEMMFQELFVFLPDIDSWLLFQDSYYLTYWYWWFHRNKHMKMVIIWIHCLDFEVIFLWYVKNFLKHIIIKTSI